MNALLQIIDGCNYKCTHCSQSAAVFNKVTKFSPLPTVLNRIKLLEKAGVKRLQLTGGEVTFHKDILSIIDFSRKKGIDISIISNGTLLNSVFCRELKDSGLKELTISLYDFDESKYESITKVKGSYKRAYNNLRTACKYFDITLNTNLSMHTELDYSKVEEVLSLQNLKAVKFIQIMEQGRAKANDDRLSKFNFDKFISSLELLKKKYKPKIKISLASTNSYELAFTHQKKCGMSLDKSITVDIDGNIFSCCILMNTNIENSLFNIDKVSTLSISESVRLWNNDTIFNVKYSNQSNESYCPALNYSSAEKFVCPIEYLSI